MDEFEFPDGVDPLELDRQVCFGLAVASRSVINLYRPVLEPLGLTHPQYLVMLALWGEAPLRFGELAHALHLDPATLSPLVKRLEALGLIERLAIDGDDRTFALRPTEAGAALRARALDVPRTIVQRLGLPIARLEALRDELGALVAATRRAGVIQ
ncbi:MAG TPA: MarR family transcriptional regulator [Microbacteriaceae bacterium]|nr:MarR family transcriptional regulator [Microbacteriaceae bacterium]